MISSTSEKQVSYLLKDICTENRGINLDTLESVLLLAVELAREGREGRRIGTIFVISDHEKVLESSTSMILDPLWNHPDSVKDVRSPDLRETLKELAQLDGAFIISDQGIAVSACRYLNSSSSGISLPLGLGTRHMAAASITKETDCIGVVVSESAIVRVFDNGEIVSEIIPELWLLRRYGIHLTGSYSTRSEGDVTVVSKDEG